MNFLLKILQDIEGSYFTPKEIIEKIKTEVRQNLPPKQIKNLGIYDTS